MELLKLLFGLSILFCLVLSMIYIIKKGIDDIVDNWFKSRL